MDKQQIASKEQEEIEGVGDQDDVSWGEDYPIDTLLIRNENRTIFDVLRRIAQGTYIMAPDFQRDFIWKRDKQSKLIESVLMRIPLPVFYLAEDKQGNMIVVDGLQRLSTFRTFVDGNSHLIIPHRPELHKKKFSDLSPKLQNRIEDCNLIFYIVDSNAPERTRLDIFERVNGGVALTRQQMRNCLFTGDATRFLKTWARSDIFLRVTGKSLRTDTMRDREFVNRFCAFQLIPLSEYKGDMDDFLAKALIMMNGMESDAMSDLADQFARSLLNNYIVFERHAFRKHFKDQKGRKPINASLWDVMSTGLSKYPTNLVDDCSENLIRAFYKLMDNKEFMESITIGTSDVRRVRHRFHIANKMFTEVLHAHAA